MCSGEFGLWMGFNGLIRKIKCQHRDTRQTVTTVTTVHMKNHRDPRVWLQYDRKSLQVRNINQEIK